jgi:hypothetical protein
LVASKATARRLGVLRRRLFLRIGIRLRPRMLPSHLLLLHGNALHLGYAASNLRRQQALIALTKAMREER